MIQKLNKIIYNSLKHKKFIKFRSKSPKVQHQQMKIFKYNNSLDDPTAFYSATLRLSKDGQSLIIRNKKILNYKKYTGTTDP